MSGPRTHTCASPSSAATSPVSRGHSGAQARLTASSGAPRTSGAPTGVSAVMPSAHDLGVPLAAPGTHHRAAPPPHKQKPAREVVVTPKPRRLLRCSGQMGQARPARGNTGCPKPGKPRRLGTEDTAGHVRQEHLRSPGGLAQPEAAPLQAGPYRGPRPESPHPRAVSRGAHPSTSAVPVQDCGLGVWRRERPTSPSVPPPTLARGAPSCSLPRTISSSLL